MIRQFGDDDGIAIRAPLGLNRLNICHPPHRHRTPACGVGFADAAAAQNLAPGWEIGAGDQGQQLALFQIRIGDQGQQAINQFGEVVGRDVGGHPHGNAGGTVEQQLGDARRHHRGFLLGSIEIVDVIDRFALDIFQQAVGC